MCGLPLGPQWGQHLRWFVAKVRKVLLFDPTTLGRRRATVSSSLLLSVALSPCGRAATLGAFLFFLVPPWLGSFPFVRFIRSAAFVAVAAVAATRSGALKWGTTSLWDGTGWAI